MAAAPSRHRLAVCALLPDVLAVATGVVVYFGIRGVTAGSAATAVDHAHDLLRLEEAIGLDVEDEVQAALVHLEPVTTVANWVYIWGHWPAIVATLVWLALRHRLLFRRLRNAMLVSGAMGLCVYTTYPVAPPRLAGLGLVDTVSEQSHAYRVLQPPAFVNQYAAMPSLHVGWDLLVGLALIAAASGTLLRTLGRTMPLAMALSTVVTANHYVLDVLAGAAFGLVGWAVALRLERRHLELRQVEGRHLEGRQVERRHLEGRRLEGRQVERRRLEGRQVERRRLEGRRLEGHQVERRHLERRHPGRLVARPAEQRRPPAAQGPHDQRGPGRLDDPYPGPGRAAGVPPVVPAPRQPWDGEERRSAPRCGRR